MILKIKKHKWRKLWTHNRLFQLLFFRYRVGHSGGISDIGSDKGFISGEWSHFEKCYAEHDYPVPCDGSHCVSDFDVFTD